MVEVLSFIYGWLMNLHNVGERWWSF